MGNQTTETKGAINLLVRDKDGSQGLVIGAQVKVLGLQATPSAGTKESRGQPAEPADARESAQPVAEGVTDDDGRYSTELSAGRYRVRTKAFGVEEYKDIEVHSGCTETAELQLPVGFAVESFLHGDQCTTTPCNEVKEGNSLAVRLSLPRVRGTDFATTVKASVGNLLTGFRQFEEDDRTVREYLYHANVRGQVSLVSEIKMNPIIRVLGNIVVLPNVQSVSGDVTVTMRRAATEVTEDLPLWVVIRKSTEALSFNNYLRFMNHVLCGEKLSPELSNFELSKIPAKENRFKELRNTRFLPFTDAEGYRILKAATEAFVIVNCGVALETFPFDQDDLDYVVKRVGRAVDLNNLWDKYLQFVNGTGSATLPYLALIRQKLPDERLKNTLFPGTDLPQECFGILRNKLTEPCLLELIWSYWNEEGMLAQTTNAITRRFQNVRGPGTPDPLSTLEIDPLRPLNNLLWGYIQDEQHRLTVVRRSYEYDHHYGLRLQGKAVGATRTADSRSKFLEAFHNLLHLTTTFFQQDDDTTVVADGFPLLNGLKETHLILSEGAHNQFGDLPSTARIEMLMQQWLLARPEFREFLPTRVMVAYPEPWMDRVDAMKKLQGWTDVSVLHFRNLAIFGEQVLLSVRFGAWSDVNDPVQAANWARFWRPEIQGYIHAYRAVTGIDLTSDRVDFTPPSVHLRNRLVAQQRSITT